MKNTQIAKATTDWKMWMMVKMDRMFWSYISGRTWNVLWVQLRHSCGVETKMWLELKTAVGSNRLDLWKERDGLISYGMRMGLPVCEIMCASLSCYPLCLFLFRHETFFIPHLQLICVIDYLHDFVNSVKINSFHNSTKNTYLCYITSDSPVSKERLMSFSLNT